jgi:hypothetical protein
MVQKWFSFFVFVKMEKMAGQYFLQVGAVLVLLAFERPASRTVNQSTGVVLVRAG